MSVLANSPAAAAAAATERSHAPAEIISEASLVFDQLLLRRNRHAEVGSLCVALAAINNGVYFYYHQTSTV